MPPKSRTKRASEALLGVEPDEKRAKIDPQIPPRNCFRNPDSTSSKSKSTGPAPDLLAPPPEVDVERIMHPRALALFSEVKVNSLNSF